MSTVPATKRPVARALTSSSPSASANWYYQRNGQIEGPFSFREMREQAREKHILDQTEVWQDGDEQQRRPADSVMGMLPKERFKPKPPANEAAENTAGQNPYSPPREATIHDGPPGGLYLPYLRHSHFWPLPLLLIITGATIFAALKLTSTAETAQTLVVLGALAAVMAVCLCLVYLHRAWEMMRVIGSTLAGHKAITLMAIPLFSGVWSFTALFGWSRAWNYQVKHHPGLSRASASWPPAFFLFCLSFVASQGFLVSHFISREWPGDPTNPMHQISLGTFALTLVLGLGVWAQLCQAINFLARKKS